MCRYTLHWNNANRHKLCVSMLCLSYGWELCQILHHSDMGLQVVMITHIISDISHSYTQYNCEGVEYWIQ